MLLNVTAGPIALLELNDPERLNAMGDEMASEFRRAVATLHDARPIAVILHGAGRAFSAGGDLAMLEEKSRRSGEQNQADMLVFYRSFLGLLELEVPLIAALHGWSVGAGFCLACACDIRLADPEARFAAPFLKLGLFPGMGATHFIPRALGPRASDILLTGRSFDAQEALQWGMISRLSQPGEVLKLAQQVGQELLLAAPEATRELLQLLRATPGERNQALEREAHLQGASYLRDEFREGVRAAQEKRAPRYHPSPGT